jgi:hypothetical protein
MSELDVQVTANVDLTDQIMNQVSLLFGNPNFWLFLASMLLTLVLVNGLKAIVKQFMVKKVPKARRWVTFIGAFFIGFFTVNYFVDGDHVMRWAIANGILNPIIYYGLLQYARVRKKIVLESILKMRPAIEDKDGNWSVHDTQTFMATKYTKGSK